VAAAAAVAAAAVAAAVRHERQVELQMLSSPGAGQSECLEQHIVRERHQDLILGVEWGWFDSVVAQFLGGVWQCWLA
jgi:hypothetical protein